MEQKTDMGPVLILDGATGTELARRGFDTSLPLWSARAVIEKSPLLGEIHRAYLDAGADAITTCTFRTHARNLAIVHMADRAAELTRRAVEIARTTRDEINPKAEVLGSVAPLEDCYSPELAPNYETCRREHGAMIQHLLEAGVDTILIETMGTIREAVAAAEVAAQCAPGKWMLSLCAHGQGAPGELLSGEAIEVLFSHLRGSLGEDVGGVRAIGLNCVPAPALASEVAHLRRTLDDAIPIIAYGNVGRPDPDQGWVNTDAIEPERYAVYARVWAVAGARMIGGCCGTTPETIAALRLNLKN